MAKSLKNQPARVANRVTYSRPTLTEFGPVGALTQAGSGMTNESAMDMKPKPNKQRV